MRKEVVTFSCDRCGRTISPGEDINTIGTVEREPIYSNRRGDKGVGAAWPFESLDTCRECFESYVAWATRSLGGR